MMLRFLLLVVIAVVTVCARDAEAQTVVTVLADGKMTFPLKVESDFYRVTLRALPQRPGSYQLDLGDIWTIDEPAQDTASLLMDEGILLIPSLLLDDTLLTNVILERADSEEYVFQIESSSNKPDVIFFNGDILTMEKRRSTVEALAISGDSIVAMGSSVDMLAMQSTSTRVIDLEGRALMPGFIDPHNHTVNSFFNNNQPQWETLDDVQQALIAAGTTTLAEPGVRPDRIQLYLDAAESGAWRIRMNLYLAAYADACGTEDPGTWFKAYGPVKDTTAMLRIPGIKIFADGGSCNNAAMSFYRENGDLYFTDKEKELWPAGFTYIPLDAIEEAAGALEGAIDEATEAGFQVAIHALGDIAIDAVQLAIRNALDGEPNTPRIRVEHNRFIRPSQLPKYGELGIIPVVFGQPYTCPINFGGPWSFLHNVPIWQSWFDPWRALIDANPGLKVAWKSDAIHFFPYQPLTHLWSLVTRNERGSSHNIQFPGYVPPPPNVICEAPDWLKANAVTVDEALEMMTINAAYAIFMEKRIGSLRPGKFADMIILSENPRTVDPNLIEQIDVLMTMIGGEVEHCAVGYEKYCPLQ